MKNGTVITIKWWAFICLNWAMALALVWDVDPVAKWSVVIGLAVLGFVGCRREDDAS